jgi:hypothetical protein
MYEIVNFQHSYNYYAKNGNYQNLQILDNHNVIIEIIILLIDILPKIYYSI